MSLKRWLKEPLVHFLLAGGALFLAASWVWPAPESERTITIGREELLGQLQERAQLYDEEGFAALLEGMSAEDRAQLLRDAAVSEALYREGQAIGLAEADPLVRQRVIQQMRMLLMEEAAADVQLGDAEIEQFYRENRERYRQGARASFTHVFFSAERRGDDAQTDARETLAQLRAGDVPFGQAGQYGDRFLYQLNYSDAGRREIAAQFGDGFADALFALDEAGQWAGPLQSQYGWHLIGLRHISPARVPPFEQIASRVREDALAEERSRRAVAAIERLMEDYTIRDAEGITR